MSASLKVRTRRKPRYRVDLREQMACCEANYARLLKLMPSLEQQDEWQYRVQSGGKSWPIRLQVVDRARYTTVLEIEQNDGFSWGGSPCLQVRLYHDAQMAEVVAWHHHRRLKPRYDYPNREMYQQDEKAQLNRFLRDWLIHSQSNGRICETVGL